MEAGYGRASGTDSHGAYWTETERDEGYEDCAECGAQIRSGWLCMDGGELVCREHVLTPEDARRIASEWHGGQDSELYKLASSGAVTSSAQFYAETELRALDMHTRRNIALPGSPLARPQIPLAHRWQERDKLRALAQWCEAVRSRGYAEATLDIREAVSRDGSSVHKLAQVAAILRSAGLYVPERRTADEERRTLPDFRTPDGRYLVCQAGAVLPDGRVIVAASARDAFTWHVLAMAPGSTTEPYYVASYVRPSDMRTPLRLGTYDSLTDALADYLAR